MAPTPPHAAFGRVQAALERGRGAEVVQLVTALQRGRSMPRDQEFALRAALVEGRLLQDDLTQAAAVLGRPPDGASDLPDAALSTIWRLHGRLAFLRRDQSRAIALHSRALKFAEMAHASRAIGLAHYELATCYKQVGDSGIVRDHLTEAAAALHAAGDKRHLALVHSLSAVLLAQAGRFDEAAGLWRQGERLAVAVGADDVLAGIVHNQANLALMRNRHEDARALAERSVALHEALGSGHGLAVALATLGQILVQLGDPTRAETILTRALEVRSSVQFHETTGAVFDTLAQVHLMRGSYERAEEYLRQASEAYGAYGTQTMRWYEWSLKVLGVKVAIRRGAYDEAVIQAEELVRTPGVPPADAIQAELTVCEALLAAGRLEHADARLAACEPRLDPRAAPATWGEFLRLRGSVHERSLRLAAAHHDFAQSATLFDLLGERYQAAVSRLALGRLAAAAGSRASAEDYLARAESALSALGAQSDLEDIAATRTLLQALPPSALDTRHASADDAIIGRLVDAAILPELLAHETANALADALPTDGVVVFVAAEGSPRVAAHARCDAEAAGALARRASAQRAGASQAVVVEAIGSDREGPRFCAAALHGSGGEAVRRFRMFAAVARQGFDLCAARDRPARAAIEPAERSLEPLLPGFVCASPAMHRLVDQIQRLQGHDLTVLITGESGTGKDLVARAIHGGSTRRSAMLLPYNCTTTTRELADSQLFGHRRGSFTGAVSDQQGLIRSASGGTLFLDEIGDLPLDIQPKLLRFLEQGEVMPVGETRPQSVDVRVLAATNADLEQRVAENRFREDLYYRLSVIRIHVPPLRERREEVPHLATFFLREAAERLGKADISLDPATLDLFARYWWPGNVRQLRNEIQRAVAMSVPGSTVTPDQLSADLTAPPDASPAVRALPPAGRAAGNLASAVEEVERDVIGATLHRTGGNISEAARMLGLTRRGLYLKLRRLGLEGVAGASDT